MGDVTTQTKCWAIMEVRHMDATEANNKCSLQAYIWVLIILNVFKTWITKRPQVFDMHFLLITSLNPLILYTASLTDIKIRLQDSLVYACYLGIIINSILFLSQKYLSLDNKLYDYLFIMCESFSNISFSAIHWPLPFP